MYTVMHHPSARRKLVKELKAIVSPGIQVEELIVRWLNKKGRIISFSIFENGQEIDPNSIQVCCQEDKRETVGFLNLPLKDMIERNEGFEPLCEKYFKFADQEGVVPDIEWFEKRNERLDIWGDEEEEVNLAPPSAMSELIASYALARNGLCQVHPSTLKGRKGYMMELVYLGPDLSEDSDVFWLEKVFIDKEELEAYISRFKKSKLH
ncbi:MAG: hypothetical protein D6808_02470 [Candidatus Dadabacteria bacterium]|nr:MAG: hypothetical protein D6808_02470 [Candidatus Dadabacteria bacterium]